MHDDRDVPRDADAAEDDAASAGNAGETADAGDRESAYELLRRGEAFLRTRHHAQAAVVLERANRLEPGKGSILEALGRARFNAGQHEAAREAFEVLLEADPASAYGHFGLGQCLRKLGRHREALTHLRLAVAMDPRSDVFRGALARATPPRG